MPPFCIGYAAESIGDYGSQAGRLDVPEDLARALAEAVIGDGIDLAVSLDMQVDHGAVQPMEIVYGDITAKPFVPIFINSVAPPFTPVAADPAARRGHRPPPRHPGPEGPAHRLRRPVARPARAAAWPRPPPPSERMLMGDGGPLSPEARDARQQRVIDAARDFAAGTADHPGPRPGMGPRAAGDPRLRRPHAARRLDTGRDDPHRRATPPTRSAPGSPATPRSAPPAPTRCSTATTGPSANSSPASASPPSPSTDVRRPPATTTAAPSR